MARPLNMFDNKITHLANLTAKGDSINKSWSESNFLKLPGGTMSGVLAMGSNKITGLPQATQNGDPVDFELFNKYTPSGYRSGQIFRLNNVALFGVIQSGNEYSYEAATVGWSNNEFLHRGGTNSMTGNFNVGNKSD